MRKSMAHEKKLRIGDMVAYFPGVYFPAGHISLYPQSLLRLTDIRYFTVMFTLSLSLSNLHKMLALSCKKQ